MVFSELSTCHFLTVKDGTTILIDGTTFPIEGTTNLFFNRYKVTLLEGTTIRRYHRVSRH